jgi:cysteine-rich repeat protein
MKSCNAMCKLNVCGDGDKGPSEACDDGNQSNNDACTNVCKLATCGDGFTQPPEQCDLGVQQQQHRRLHHLVQERRVRRHLRPAEQHGAVRRRQHVEHGRLRPGLQAAACGDTFVQQGVEQCDDGNQVQTDTCINTCKTAACGDGFVQPSNAEQCDDANMSNTDACVGACKTAVCGDGFVRAGVEQCDDANMSNNDACVQGCLTAKCGDGFVRAGVEQCDDGNQNNADGCSNNCTTPACGNGVIDGAEECDDANQSNLDACSTECLTIRSKVMVCGGTSRPVNTFFPPGFNFMVVNSCAPDAQTQALFYTRGAGANAVPQATMQAYLNAGGIVLTEHNISDEVWTSRSRRPPRWACSPAAARIPRPRSSSSPRATRCGPRSRSRPSPSASPDAATG